MRHPDGHPCLACIIDAVMRPLDRVRPEVVGPAQGRVLEVGAGTGLNFHHYGAHADVDAIEPDPHMLRRARPRAHRHGVRLIQAGAESLPFEDHAFDAVVATFVFCTIPDPVAAARELGRVLKPGGTLHLAEHVVSTWAPLAWAQAAVDPVWTRLSGGCHLDRDPIHLLESAGFETQQLRRAGGGRTPVPVVVGALRAPA